MQAPPATWARQFFDDTTRTALHTFTDASVLGSLTTFQPDKSWTIVQRYTPGCGSGQAFKLGMASGSNWYWDSYIEIYQGTVGLRWHHKDNSGGSGHDRVDLYPDFSIVEGTTYDLAITYDATLFNAGPGTHPDAPPDGGSQEGLRAPIPRPRCDQRRGVDAPECAHFHGRFVGQRPSD